MIRTGRIMSPLYIILAILCLVPSKSQAEDPFCSGVDYIIFETTYKPDYGSTPMGSITSEEIEFYFYSAPNEYTYLGLVIYYRKDTYLLRLHNARMCCFITKNELGNVVQRMDRNTLVYRLKDNCYQVTYGYSVVRGAHIVSSGYISCQDVDICRPSLLRPPTPSYFPHSTAPTVTTPNYESLGARFQELSPSRPLTDSAAPISSRFQQASPTRAHFASTDSYYTASTPTGSRTDQFRYSGDPPPPPTPIYPVSSFNPIIQHGSNDFCIGTKNYIELDPLADFGRYKDSVTWGRFKLTLYTMLRYQSSVSGLEIKYLPNDFNDPREISLGKYRTCCDITLNNLDDKALKLQGTSTLVFKLQEYGSDGTLCRVIPYTYVARYGTLKREVNAADAQKIPCLELSFCKHRIH